MQMRAWPGGNLALGKTTVATGLADKWFNFRLIHIIGINSYFGYLDG